MPPLSPPPCNENAQNPQGRTILHTAVFREDDVRSILEKGEVDIDAQDNNGYTALHLAGDNCWFRTLVHLLTGAQRPNLFIQDNSGRTALMAAIVYGYPNGKQEEFQGEAIRLMLAREPSLINLQCACGWTALHYAGRHGTREIVNLLLDQRPDLTLRDRSGQTALHVAMCHILDPDHKYIAQCFLDHPNGYRDSKHLLEQDMDGETPLHWLILGRQDTSVIQYVVERGADVSIANRHGKTPFHYAAEYGVVASLTCHGTGAGSRGATGAAGAAAIEDVINKADDQGMTALHYAIHHKNALDIEILMNMGADVTIPDHSGRTALDYL